MRRWNAECRIQNADTPWLRIAFCLHFAFCILHYADPANAQDTVGRPIVEVTVEQEGQPVTDPLVRGLIETTVGEPLSMRDVRETIEHLMNLQRFENVEPSAEAVADGVRVRYVLFPTHPVDRVEFRGMLGIGESDLQRLVTERFGRAPSATRAMDVAQALQLAYRQRGYPNARVTPAIEETHNPDRATLIFDIMAGARARIAAVRITQVDEREAGTLIGVPNIRQGDFYDADEVNAALRAWEERLKEQGYYEARASHGADIADTEAYLRVNIARGPKVVVAFTGDPLPEDERERLVPVRAEGSADEDLLEDAKLAVERYLHERGYRDAVATYTRSEDTPGELRITFDVKRGPRYTVENVELTGNAAFSAAELLEILRIARGALFVRTTLGARVNAIQNAYRTRGYTRAQVDTKEEALPPDRPGDPEREVDITIAITEGPRTTVRAVTFEGNMVLTEGALRALVMPAAGRLYSQGEVAEGRDRIDLEYRNLGYEGVSVRQTVTLADNDTQADVRYTIVEGPQSIIDHVIIIGNDRTSTGTITDELLFREGGPLGYAALIDSRARLAALGLFRRIDIQPLQHSGESRRDVLVRIEEADPTTIGFGGGMEVSYRSRVTEANGAPEEKLEVAPRGFFEVGRRNLWGKNRSVNLFTRVSLRSTDIRLDNDQVESNPGFNEYRVLGTFREPRLFTSRADLLITGIVEQAIRTTFNFSRRIARAEVGRRLSGAISLTGRYSFERAKLFDVALTDDQNPVLIDRIFPQVRISKVAASFIRDTRDDLLDASRGNFVIGDADLAARAIGSQVGFIKTYLQAFTYRRLPMTRRVVVALAGRVGAARGFARESTGGIINDLPASERFFAGGDTSVRGFSLDRLASAETVSSTGFPLGGNAVVVLNSELRVAVFGDVQAVGFFDLGNVFRRVSDLDLTDLRPAAGVGFRYKSPVGPLRLDWGFNLDPRQLVPGTLERGNVLHISLGQAF
jgi:outer membrane protein insertion porin family